MPTTSLGPIPNKPDARLESGPLIELDEAVFHPWRIQAIRHRLADHPLLQLDALVELGMRLEARGCVRTHSNSATAGTPFNNAPKLHPNAQGAASTLKGIENAKAWMSLLNVQTDQIYRQLVGSVLDSIQTQIDRTDPGMCYRAGWIFVSSPRAVTPFHFDKEHNFIVQINGRKRIYVWDHRDTLVASELARDRFHDCHDRDLLRWQESFRERALVLDLGPGEGAYMPSTSPHMVENGDQPSITMSFTYYTTSTRRDALLHKTHALMRGIGMTPPAVGRMPLFDAVTCASAKAMQAARDLVHAHRGGHTPVNQVRFAKVAP